MARPNLDIVL